MVSHSPLSMPDTIRFQVHEPNTNMYTHKSGTTPKGQHWVFFRALPERKLITSIPLIGRSFPADRRVLNPRQNTRNDHNNNNNKK